VSRRDERLIPEYMLFTITAGWRVGINERHFAFQILHQVSIALGTYWTPLEVCPLPCLPAEAAESDLPPIGSEMPGTAIGRNMDRDRSSGQLFQILNEAVADGFSCSRD
jgi:hypothetical protein